MSTLEEAAASIAETAGDYRQDDLGSLTEDHVLRWIRQFDRDDRLPVLEELDHVLKKTYFSEENVTSFLNDVATTRDLVGDDAEDFWRGAGVLNIQQGGNSQREMVKRFETILGERYGLDLDDCEGTSGVFLYLDDAIFTGNRVKRDLRPWIENDAPDGATVHIVVSAVHSGGQHYAEKALKQLAGDAGKTIQTKWWREKELENRLYYRSASEVLWPSELPDEDEDESVFEYVQRLRAANYPPALRPPGGTPVNGVFSGEPGRAVLESVFLKMGMRIRGMCPYLPETSRPLGFSILKTLGFGALTVTYRNCPNNCPLALWAGDPWYPLFSRKTN